MSVGRPSPWRTSSTDRTALARAVPRWRPALLLAAPFLVAVALLRGLTVGIVTFHSTDELNYHLPTIERFAHQLPFVDLVHYPAAQTPLFHLGFAVALRVVGPELWLLRLLNVAISYALALVLYRLLRGDRGLPVPQATLLSLLVVLSPYVFGTSFLLLTDNLALLLAVGAIGALESYRRRRATGWFALACALAGAAVLTRQSYLWLMALCLLWALRLRRGNARAIAEAGCVLLALVPFALLVGAWGGLEPPAADPASCGLCGGTGALAGVSVAPAAFTLALVGLYAVALHRLLAPRLRVDRARGTLARVALAASVAVALLLAAPLSRHGSDGFLWRISAHGPTVLGSSWVFWVLVPLGSVVLALTWRREDPLPHAMIALFLLSTLATAKLYQKYFDPIALLTLVLLVPARPRLRAGDLAAPIVLAGAFAAYAVVLTT